MTCEVSEDDIRFTALYDNSSLAKPSIRKFIRDGYYPNRKYVERQRKASDPKPIRGTN